ncbi:hypothetical protein N665_0134s0027 [Sinapis alba]|nr:hypothetical protein N665_0134s0027 [Sinapis alba]
MELSLSTSSASPAVLKRQASPLLHKQQVLSVSFASAVKPGGALRFRPRRRLLYLPALLPRGEEEDVGEEE